MGDRRWNRHLRITVLGALLCLLAAAFAIEAKLSWYSPDGNVRVAISSDKLQPADAPRLTVHPTIPPAGVVLAVEALFLVGFTALFPQLTVFRGSAEIGLIPVRLSFSPPHFFRPPPRW